MDIFQVCSDRWKVFFCNLGYYERRDNLPFRGYIEERILLGERTPYGFVVVDDVVSVCVVGVNNIDEDLFLGVSKGAEISVLAGCGIFVEELAEFSFVAGGMVELLDFVVRPFAVAVGLIAEDVIVVVEIGSSPVLFTVIVQTHFPLVLIWIEKFIPVRLHLKVLNVAISNLKNYPCSKKED